MTANVRDFGAKGDGIADDAPAFRRAIEAISAAPPSSAPATVHVPLGTYKLAQTLDAVEGIVIAGE